MTWLLLPLGILLFASWRLDRPHALWHRRPHIACRRYSCWRRSFGSLQ